jgi:hypothetical protein
MIDSFLRKYQEKLSGFKSITDFRKIKQHISVARAAERDDYMLYLLEQFIRDDKMEISDLEIDTARVHREASVLLRSISKLGEQISALDPDMFVGEDELWVELEQVIEVIRAKLAQADRRPI